MCNPMPPDERQSVYSVSGLTFGPFGIPGPKTLGEKQRQLFGYAEACRQTNNTPRKRAIVAWLGGLIDEARADSVGG